MGEQASSTENLIKFRKALNDFADTENGKYILDFLEATYVDASAMHENNNVTLYALGQKEWVQGFIKDARTKEDYEQALNNITREDEYDY